MFIENSNVEVFNGSMQVANNAAFGAFLELGGSVITRDATSVISTGNASGVSNVAFNTLGTKGQYWET